MGGVPQWAQPQARLHLDAAVGKVPVVHRCSPLRLKVGPDIATGQSSQGSRGVRRSKRCCTNSRNIHVAFGRHQGQSIQVRRLALVGPHARSGVALEVLYGLVAFEVCQFDIRNGDVVLKVNKRFALRPRAEQGSSGNKRHGGGIVEPFGLSVGL